MTPKGTQGRTSNRRSTGGHRPLLDDRTTRGLEMLVGDIEDSIEVHDDADLIATEKSLACMLGLHTASNWNPVGIRASAVLDHAERIDSAAGAVIAAGMSVYGPPPTRDRARRILERLRADGADVPGWAASLGAVEPVGATKYRDEWDEGCALVVDFVRPDGSTHEMCVGLQPFGWGMAHGLAITPTGQAKQRLAEAGLAAEPIGLEQVRDLLVNGLEHLDETLADWWDNDLDLDADVDMRPLVGQRVDTLPRGADSTDAEDRDEALAAERIGDVIRGFVALPTSLGEEPEEVALIVAGAALFSQVCRDPDIVRWTPPRIETFIEQFLPLWDENEAADAFGYDPFDEFGEPGDAFEFSEERLSTAESVFPRWLRYAAEWRGDSAETLEANLAAAHTSLRKLRIKITGSSVPPAAPPIQWE